ncbi:hypothetical protein EI969_04170 [Pseudomonas sp. PB101]|nr:hypothetical protein [Pseudomonas sp. PB101]
MWERACPRWGHNIQHLCRLSDRHRGQARSHRVLRWLHIHGEPQITVEAGLPAKRECQLTLMVLTPRYREQARSYRAYLWHMMPSLRVGRSQHAAQTQDRRPRDSAAGAGHCRHLRAGDFPQPPTG